MAAICCSVCTGPCKALGHCCMACEHGCDKTCHFCCKLGCCCGKERPSPIFLSYTFLVNIPLAVIAITAGIQAFAGDVTKDSWCRMFLHPGIYLFIAAAFAIFFMIFAIRIYVTFSGPGPAGHGDIEAGKGKHKPARSQFKDKVWYTACHDVFTFLYFLAIPASVVWCIIGLTVDGVRLDGCGLAGWAIRVVAAIGLLYLICTIFVALTSCCWEMRRLAHLPPPPSAQAEPAQDGPAKFMQHMIAPGFDEQVATPAAAPPYAQAPPVAQMTDPSATAAAPARDSTYPTAMPPNVGQAYQEYSKPTASATPAPVAASTSHPAGGSEPAAQQSVFAKMKAAFR